MQGVLFRQGCRIGRDRVRSLMRKMGLSAIYPKPKTSIASIEHKKYPYLLRSLNVRRPNHVWCMDITYLRMKGGFVYLAAVMDWFSRFILGWRLSNSMDTSFCLEAVEESFSLAKPEIFNTDQGVQFTSADFTGFLESSGVRVSMDGKRRWVDNVFIERFWRSVKYELVYLKDYHTCTELYRDLNHYITYYNHERPHQSFDFSTPNEMYQADAEGDG